MKRGLNVDLFSNFTDVLIHSKLNSQRVIKYQGSIIIGSSPIITLD